MNDSVRRETYFYPSGGIHSIGTTINGEKKGIWEYYYDNGLLKEKGEYSLINVSDENFHTLSKRFNKDIVFGNHISLKDGTWQIYKKDGRLEKKEIYNLGIIVK